MKKFLGLVLFLLLAVSLVPVITSCGDKGNDPVLILPPPPVIPQKVIEEQYRGTFSRISGNNTYTYRFTTNTLITESTLYQDVNIYPAWTVGAELHRDETNFYSKNPDVILGTFEDKDTFKNRTSTYTRINN
jgi:hypothetical protein